MRMLSGMVGMLGGIVLVISAQWWVPVEFGLMVTQCVNVAIVVFGVFLALSVTFSFETVLGLFTRLSSFFELKRPSYPLVIREISETAEFARKEGILSLDRRLSQIKNPLLKKGLQHVIDGLEQPTVKGLLDQEIEKKKERDSLFSNMFRVGAHAAPAFGMVVMLSGVIRSFEYLAHPEMVVAQVGASLVPLGFGVVLAQLVFLPLAHRARIWAQLEVRRWELVREGVLGIQLGINPNALRLMLETIAGVAGKKNRG